MVKVTTSAIYLAAAVLDVALAGPAAEPMITPGPLLKERQLGAQNFIGYYSLSSSGSSVVYDSYTCKAGYTFTSSGNYFKCCTTGAAGCTLYTGCSGTYLVGPSASFGCSALSSGAYCSSDRLFPTPGALQAQSYMWCGTGTDAGTDIFRATVAGAVTFPSSISTITDPISTGTARGSSGSSAASRTSSGPSPTSTGKSSTPVGAIVGGVVGGLAVLGIAAAGIIFLLLRRKRKAANNPNGAAYSEKPSNMPPQAPMGGYQQSPPQAYGQPQYGAPPPAEYGAGGGYYYDNKSVSPQQQQVYPQHNQSPIGGAAYPSNPHDSMYKPPMSPQPPANTFELDSSQHGQMAPSPGVSQVSPVPHAPSPAQGNAPVELATHRS